MENKKGKEVNLAIFTDRNNKGDSMGLHARLPLFNELSVDLSPGELLILSWARIAQYSSYKWRNVRTTYGEIGRILNTSKNNVVRILKKLDEKGLLKLSTDKEGIVIGGKFRELEKRYRTIAKVLVTSDVVSFKTKGFLIALLVTSNDYIIDIGNISSVAKGVGMDRSTVKKYYKELEGLGFIHTTGNGDALLDIEQIIERSVDRAVDRMLTAEEEVIYLRGELAKRDERIKVLTSKLARYRLENK